MREIQCAVVNIDRYLEDAARAKHQLDAAVALQRSGRRDGLSPRFTPDHHGPDSLARLGPVKALRFASTPHGGGACGLDRALGRALRRLLRDGRAVRHLAADLDEFLASNRHTPRTAGDR